MLCFQYFLLPVQSHTDVFAQQMFLVFYGMRFYAFTRSAWHVDFTPVRTLDTCQHLWKPQIVAVFLCRSWKVWISTFAIRSMLAGGRRWQRASIRPTSREESITPSMFSERTSITRKHEYFLIQTQMQLQFISEYVRTNISLLYVWYPY